MIVPLSIVSLLGLVCLALLASPYPFLAPGAVLGLVGVASAVLQARLGLAGHCCTGAVRRPVQGQRLFRQQIPWPRALIMILMLQLAVHRIPGTRLRSNIWRPC